MKNCVHAVISEDPREVDDDGLITRDQFITLEERHARRLAEQIELDKGSDGHNNHIMRRWAVRLWNFQLESLIKDEAMVFVNINWGGSREEARIKTGEGEKWWQFLSDTEVVWGLGSEPYCLRSDVEELKEKGKIAFKNEFRFEWIGSYAELETQQMTIEVWRWNKFRANTLDSVHRATLVSYATGPVFQSISLAKASIAKLDGFVINNKEELPRFRGTFQLYFQEIYDFELHVIDVQAVGLLGHSQLSKAKPDDFSKFSRQQSSLSVLPSGEGDDSAMVRSIYDDTDESGEEEEDKSAIESGKKFGVKKMKKYRAKRRVQLEIRNPSVIYSMRRGVMMVRSELRKIDRGNMSGIDRWGNVGKIFYRGTLADLDNDLLRLQIFETNMLSPVPTVVGEASVSLRGVYEYGTVGGACYLPEWVVKRARAASEQMKQLIKASVGRFEAKIMVDNLPKYRQSGELCDMVNDKAYLLVKVLRVDRVAVPDQRPMNQCDSAVQVQFSGNSYETDVQQDSVTPQFDQEFYFELKTTSPADFTPDELAAMHGPIIFDVWLRSDDEGALTAEHCGHAEISLTEIFAEGKPETKTHTSIRTGSVIEYKTVVLKARRRLTCLWTGVGGNVNVPASAALPTHLFVDIWLRPFDFSASSISQQKVSSNNKGKLTMRNSVSNILLEDVSNDPLLPSAVRAEWNVRSREWTQRVRKILDMYWGVSNRWFDFSGKSQNRDEHFLPLFLDVLRPPQQIANPRAIAFWIHCLPNTSMEALKAASRFLFTPDFTLSLGKGDSFAHAILHCSMLRGLVGNSNSSTTSGQNFNSFKAFRPFVCLGTGWDSEPLAWVMVFTVAGDVVFYDTAGHRQFELPRRIADAARCRRVVSDLRQPSQVISQELVALEIRRRLRLVKQEQQVQKLAKFQIDSIDCDPLLFRSPEILKVVDPEFHPHALIFTSDVAPEAICYRCGTHPERRKLQGFVCNRKVSKSLETPACEDGMFLCLSCAERAKQEAPIPKDSDGKFVMPENLPVMKFAEMPVLPYKSIDIVFDHTNCWLNLQHYCPSSIFYDLWNPLYWHPFTSVVTAFRSFSLASKGFRKARNREYFDNIRLRIVTKLKKSIESVRRNGNLPTFYQRDELLIAHIERGLELSFRKELVNDPSTEKLQLDSDWSFWKLQLYSKVPARHRFVGHSFLFSFTDSIEISRIILDRVDMLSFREIGTQLVVSTFIGKLPNSVKAAYVYVGIAFPLSDSIAAQTIETRAQDVFQTSRESNAFTDEVIERNRLFVQRMQTFDNEADFLSKMRSNLSNNENTNGKSSANLIASLKQTGSSRAPVSAENIVNDSLVDFSSNLQKQDDQTPLLSDDRSSSSPFPDLGIELPSNASTAFGWLPPLPKMDQMPSLPEVSISLDSVIPPSSGGENSFFSNLFGFGSSLEASKPTPQRVPREPVYRAPKDLSKKGPIVTPLSLSSALNPTEEELQEIYKPYTVEKVVGQRQYIRHLPSGYAIPIPPQEPLQQAADLGGDDLVARVRVKSAHTSAVVKKVNPPKEMVYEYNMNANVSPRRKSSNS